MNGVYQFTELPERRCVFVKLRHSRIDRKKIECGEGTAVFPHHRVCRRHRKRRQGLDYSKAHVAHDQRQAPHYLAKRSELPRENRINRIVLVAFAALHFYMEIGAFDPLGNIRAFGEKARLAGKNANLLKRNLRGKTPRRDFFERIIVPGSRHRHFAALGLRDYFTPPYCRAADIRAKRRAPFSRRFQG